MRRRERARVPSFDSAASTAALPSVLERVQEFLPLYSSIHRGAGYKSQMSTAAYEDARDAAIEFAGRPRRDDVAIFCRNTTEALNHLAYRMRFERGDVVATTVVEHHANLLPWSRARRMPLRGVRARRHFRARRVWSQCSTVSPKPKLLAVTAASNITGWLPPIDADHRGRPRPGHPRLGRRGTARAAQAASGRRGFHRVERPQDVRPIRRGSSRSDPASSSRRATLSSPVEERSISSTWTR